MSNVDLVEVFVDPTGPEIIEVMSPGPPGVQGPTGATGATGAGFTSIASGTILGNGLGDPALPQALNASSVRSLLSLATFSEVAFAGLSFTGTGSAGLVLKSITTAQYNALTPANGDLFRDSTTDRIDARLARGTVELIDTAGGQTINGALTATNLTGINTGDQNIYAVSAIDRSKKLRLVAGVVRPTRSGTSLTWNWISDTDHAPVGFGSISSTSAHLILNFDATYGKAITCFVLPDEFFQKYGFQCGVSLGLSAMTVTMTANYNSVTSYSHNGTSWSNASSSSGNFVTAVSVSGNITTLTLADYGAGGAASQFSHSIPIYHGSNNRYARMVNSGLGVNQVRFELIDPATGTAQAPASGDRISLQNPNPRIPVDLLNASTTGLGQDFFQDSAITGNFWVFAIMEEA